MAIYFQTAQPTPKPITPASGTSQSRLRKRGYLVVNRVIRAATQSMKRASARAATAYAANPEAAVEIASMGALPDAIRHADHATARTMPPTIRGQAMTRPRVIMVRPPSVQRDGSWDA